MEEVKKFFVALTFFTAFGAIIFVCVSLGTNHWVESEPRVSNVTSPSTANFGLFKGDGILNVGNGDRIRNFAVRCSASEGVCVMYDDQMVKESALDYIRSALNSNITGSDYEKGLFPYSFWLLTIVGASLVIVFGLVAMVFAVFNVFGKPIETITGPMGLYVWNGIGVLFVILEMTFYLVLFFGHLKKNFIIDDSFTKKFEVESYTTLGYSFYLVPAAGALFLINLILLLASGYKLKCSFSSEAEKVVDSGIILY